MNQQTEINGLRLYAQRLAERINIVVDWSKVNDSKSLKETIYYLEYLRK